MRKVFKVLEIEAMKELKTPMANKITTEAKAPQKPTGLVFWETMTKTISIKTVTTYMCVYIYIHTYIYIYYIYIYISTYDISKCCHFCNFGWSSLSNHSKISRKYLSFQGISFQLRQRTFHGIVWHNVVGRRRKLSQGPQSRSISVQKIERIRPTKNMQSFKKHRSSGASKLWHLACRSCAKMKAKKPMQRRSIRCTKVCRAGVRFASDVKPLTHGLWDQAGS